MTMQPVKTPNYLKDVPAQLPLRILLGLPDYVTSDLGAPIFNIMGAITRLLGRFGYERASRILNPKIWAPQWRPEQFQSFATSDFLEHHEVFEGIAALRLAAPDFPGTGALHDLARPDFPTYDVIHILGRVRWRGGERTLTVSERDDLWMLANDLCAAAKSARTRLLILQVAMQDHDLADALGHDVAEAGGPATLVVACPHPGPIHAYLQDLYSEIVHNRPLEFVTASADPEVRATLHAGDGSSDVLRFDRYLDALQARASHLAIEVTEAVQRREPDTWGLERRAETHLHRDQVHMFKERINESTERLSALRQSVEKVSGDLRADLNWAREGGGVEPLSRIAETLDTLAAQAEQAPYPALEDELQAAVENGPRVLNANFANPESRRILLEREGLVSGREYDLLVDVGPRWNTIPTIVTGHDAFPEDALPPTPGGHVIDVVLVSDDFDPQTASARIWLPQGRGRSHPWHDGAPRQKSGPVALRIKMPPIGNPQATSQVARGRLFLYYQNNLLQSAIVSAAIVEELAEGHGLRNEVKVDYALTGAFHAIGKHFETRELRLADGEQVGNHPVKLNITLNHSGSGTHRILVRQQDDLMTAWTAYDPSAALQSLREARKVMLGCFSDLNSVNGKSRASFLMDLYHLAKVGNLLYTQVLNQLRTGSGELDAIAWDRRLRQLLGESSVIQVSRIESTPTQYAFPWALLYEYPLTKPGTELRWCDVLTNEWSKDGRRERPLAARCPYQDEAWHAENVLCPYGFWGLKHVIEQPLASSGATPLEAANRIPVGRGVTLSVAWTRDKALNLSHIEEHVQRLKATPGLRLAEPPPNPADDSQGVRALLSAANLAYFICHCEQGEQQPYLSIGARDGDASRTIYPSTVTDWARTTLGAWAENRPLVFINGCHTGDLKPGEVLNFVSAFGLARAAGVIGTEVSVQVPLAAEIAERLFDKLVAREGGKLGQALREVRWELANKGNLLGLCYTAYGLADLQFARA